VTLVYQNGRTNRLHMITEKFAENFFYHSNECSVDSYDYNSEYSE